MYYNEDALWYDVVEVMRRNLQNEIVSPATIKCIDEIKTLKPQLIIVVQPWYFKKRAAFFGKSAFPAMQSYDYAEVEIYDASNYKLLEGFNVNSSATIPNYLETEIEFANKIWERLQYFKVLQK